MKAVLQDVDDAVTPRKWGTWSILRYSRLAVYYFIFYLNIYLCVLMYIYMCVCVNICMPICVCNIAIKMLQQNPTSQPPNLDTFEESPQRKLWETPPFCLLFNCFVLERCKNIQQRWLKKKKKELLIVYLKNVFLNLFLFFLTMSMWNVGSFQAKASI